MAPEDITKFMDKIMGYGRRKPKRPDHYSSFNRRMKAATIDWFVLLLFSPLINRLAPVDRAPLDGYVFDPGDPHAAKREVFHMLSNQAFLQSWIANFLMFMFFWCVLSAIFLHFFSATPGKLLLRMKVVNAENEGHINELQVALRSFGYLVSAIFFCLGFMWINFNKRRRGWHDILADTVVINLPMPQLLSRKTQKKEAETQ